MARFGLALPSLARLICPELRSALALRAVSRCLQLAISEAVLCTLVLCNRKLVPKRVLYSCAAKLPCLLRDAVAFAETVLPALLDTLETFASDPEELWIDFTHSRVENETSGTPQDRDLS